jgi:hypothetical protein
MTRDSRSSGRSGGWEVSWSSPPNKPQADKVPATIRKRTNFRKVEGLFITIFSL